jgi:hypothetical protein
LRKSAKIIKNATNFIIEKYGRDYEFLTKNHRLVTNGFKEKFESEIGYTDKLLPEAIKLIKDKIEYHKWATLSNRFN